MESSAQDRKALISLERSLQVINNGFTKVPLVTAMTRILLYFLDLDIRLTVCLPVINHHKLRNHMGLANTFQLSVLPYTGLD